MAGQLPSGFNRCRAKCCRYPALHRLEQQGWIKSKWAESETGRQAKFYSLTAAGRAQLEKETANWNRLSAAINLIVSEA